MTNETVTQILNLYDRAVGDPEYAALHADYAKAQTVFSAWLRRLPEEERQIVENYLHTSVALYHRLLEMALKFSSNL